MIKFNHKAKSFSECMGMSEKRWDEVTAATKQAFIDTDTTPKTIQKTIEILKKVTDTDLVIIGYIVGAYHAKNNFGSGDMVKAALPAALLK